MFNFLELPIPMLVSGAVLAFVAAIALLARLRMGRLAVAAMFFLASIGVAKAWWGGEIHLWLYPIQSSRSLLYILTGVLLMIGVLGHAGSVSFVSLPRQGMLLMAIALYAALLRAVHESPAAGGASFLFAMVTILPILLIVPAMLEEWDDWTAMLRALMLANAAWIAAVAIQFAINPGALTVDRSARFVGLTGNPQHAGTLLAVTCTIALWLYLNDPKQRYRLWWLALIGANVVLLAWTGSRTGMGMLTIGIAAALYSRMGRSILYLPAVAFILFGAFKFAQVLGIDLGIERLASTENTRGDSWGTLLDNGIKNPLWGAGVLEAGDSENSYLFGFASYGLGMVALMALMLLVSLQLMLHLLWVRRWLDPSVRYLIDLIVGYNGMYFAGGMFEGYMMSRVSANLAMMLIMSCMASRLLHKATSQEEEVFEDDEYDEYDEYPEDEYGEYGEYGDYGKPAGAT